MRSRNIKPGICDNEVLGSGDIYCQFAFACLPMLADKEGRLEYRPMRIRAQIFPYRPDIDMVKILDWLEQNGFIRRFTVSSPLSHREYLHIENFAKHQRPHHTEKASEIPAPPSEKIPGEQGKEPITVSSPLSHREYLPDSLIPDSKNNIPPYPSGSPPLEGGDAKNPSAKKKRTKEKMLLVMCRDFWPDDFKPAPGKPHPELMELVPRRSMADYAEQRGMPESWAAAQWESFRDHWHSKAERRLDWAATWRMWVRKAIEFDERNKSRYG